MDQNKTLCDLTHCVLLTFIKGCCQQGWLNPARDIIVNHLLKTCFFGHIFETFLAPFLVTLFTTFSGKLLFQAVSRDVSIQRASLSTILGRSHFVKLSNNPWNSVKGNPSLLYILLLQRHGQHHHLGHHPQTHQI